MCAGARQWFSRLDFLPSLSGPEIPACFAPLKLLFLFPVFLCLLWPLIWQLSSHFFFVFFGPNPSLLAPTLLHCILSFDLLSFTPS